MIYPTLTFLQNGDEGTDVLVWILIGVGLLLLFVILVVFLRYLNLYIQSLLTKAGVGLLDMIAMQFRKVNPSVVVRAKIMAVQAGLEDVVVRNFEAHLLAGGNLIAVLP